MSLANGTCDRCNNETHSFNMSYFNTDMCCNECIEKERAHPKYAEAKQIEYEECSKGNLNFEGIGLPEDLRV